MFKVGKIYGDEVKIRIDFISEKIGGIIFNTKVMVATVMDVDKFWSTRPEPIFKIGMQLTFIDNIIAFPKDLPWFILYEGNFEHYR